MSSTSLARTPAEELADRWEVRALREARGITGAVVVAILAAEVPIALPVLLRVAFPGFKDITLPALFGYASIRKDGSVVSSMINKDHSLTLVRVYHSDVAFRGDFRRLADKIRATDAERNELFGMIQKWVVADARFDHRNKKTVN